MSERKPADVVLSFVEKINAHEVEELCGLMAEDHVFVDSQGKVVRGRESMRQAWRGYFAWFPDYKICVTETLQEGNTVALFGSASGTYCVNGRLLPENRWEIPAAWRAVVRDGLVAQWQVYADNAPVLRIMGANRA